MAPPDGNWQMTTWDEYRGTCDAGSVNLMSNPAVAEDETEPRRLFR